MSIESVNVLMSVIMSLCVVGTVVGTITIYAVYKSREAAAKRSRAGVAVKEVHKLPRKRLKIG